MKLTIFFEFFYDAIPGLIFYLYSEINGVSLANTIGQLATLMTTLDGFSCSIFYSYILLRKGALRACLSMKKLSVVDLKGTATLNSGERHGSIDIIRSMKALSHRDMTDKSHETGTSSTARSSSARPELGRQPEGRELEYFEVRRKVSCYDIQWKSAFTPVSP